MSRMRKAALVSELVDKLQKEGSWCGETHIQKATYLLENLFDVPLDYEFILYKHGPYSFELRNALTAMRADNLLELQPRQPYGPSYITTEASRELRKRYPKTLKEFGPVLEFVAVHLGSQGVFDLEQLSTALYVKREMPGASNKVLAERIRFLKPHITAEAATSAVDSLERISKEVEQTG